MADDPKDELARTTLEIPAEVFRAMKLFCVDRDVKMRAFLTDAIRERLQLFGVAVDDDLASLSARTIELAKMHGTSAVRSKLDELAAGVAESAGGRVA